MITQSSIPAADALWVEVGLPSLQRFLNRARMTHTVLARNGVWGQTEITAHDEIAFLWVLSPPNGWLINSIGGFTHSGQDYAFVVLTQNNATMNYGVTTIENIAVKVNHDLN